MAAEEEDTPIAAEEEDTPMRLEPHGRPRDSTVVVSASHYAGYGDEQSRKAVLAMLKIAADDWSKLLFFANDAMHTLVHKLVSERRFDELPVIEDPKHWEAVVQYVYALRNGAEALRAKRVKISRSDSSAAARHEAWKSIIEVEFAEHDLALKSPMHTNQFEAMATSEATNCAEYNKKKTVRAHVKRYLIAKYELGYGGAGEMADRVLADDPLNFEKIKNKAMAKTHRIEDAKAIVETEADLYHSFVGFGEIIDSRCLCAYRFFMLQAIDQISKKISGRNKGKPQEQQEALPKRFSLIPMHACGSALTATVTGNWMKLLLPAIKHEHREFFGRVTSQNRAAKPVIKAANAHLTSVLDPEAEVWHPDGGVYYMRDEKSTENKLPINLTTKLWFYFHGLHKIRNPGKKLTKWRLGGSIKTNGVELHVTFVRNKRYMNDGRPLPEKYVPRVDRADPKTWDVPAWPREMPKDNVRWTDLAGVDVGHHNIYYATRYTGEYTNEGDPEVEVRKVKKTWYDRASGRTAILHKSKRLVKTAQKKGLMDDITENSIKTADSEAFIRGIRARRDAWQPLYQIFSNKKAKRLKLAMRARENQAIDRAIQYITWKGKVVPAIGDCSRTTGIRGLSPGAPVKKMGRRMVQRGYSCFEVKEGNSSKASVCCHGAMNKCQANNQPQNTYKVKKGGQPTNKPVPSEVHGILICQNCGRTWDRDLVGGLNITDIGIDHLMGLERQWRFTKALQAFTGEVEPVGIIPRQSISAGPRTVAKCRSGKTPPWTRKSRKSSKCSF